MFLGVNVVEKTRTTRYCLMCDSMINEGKVVAISFEERWATLYFHPHCAKDLSGNIEGVLFAEKMVHGLKLDKA